MTQESFQKKLPPPDAIRGALLLGIVVGQRSDIVVPACEECRAQIKHLSSTVFGPPPARPTHRVGEVPESPRPKTSSPAAKVAPPAAKAPEAPKAPPSAPSEPK